MSVYRDQGTLFLSITITPIVFSQLSRERYGYSFNVIILIRSLRLRQGQFFGEIGLISGRRRTATVKAGAGQQCVLIETPRPRDEQADQFRRISLNIMLIESLCCVLSRRTLPRKYPRRT